MNRSWTVEAVIVTAGLMVVGFCIMVGLNNFADRDRVVNVKGLAEIEVPANKVTWPIVYKELGNELPELYTRINTTNGAIIEFLKKNGITESEIAVKAPEVIDLRADRYNTTPSPQRYNVTSVITVTSNQVDKVRKLITSQMELLKQGIAIVAGEYNNPITYDYTLLNEIKPKMIEEATKNARATAEQFAKDSDSELGKIMNANQGQFSIEDRDSNTPFIKKVRVVTTINYALKD